MLARLHQTWISALAGLPETGMGYQVVSLPDLGPRSLAIIGGAKELLEFPPLRTRVFERGHQGTAEDVVKLLGEPKGTAPVRVLSRSEAQAAGAIEVKAILGSGPASAAPVELSDLERSSFDSRLTPTTSESWRMDRLQLGPTSLPTTTGCLSKLESKRFRAMLCQILLPLFTGSTWVLQTKLTCVVVLRSRHSANRVEEPRLSL